MKNGNQRSFYLVAFLLYAIFTWYNLYSARQKAYMDGYAEGCEDLRVMISKDYYLTPKKP